MISASDAGAHNDVTDQYAQTSRLFDYAVTKYGLMPVEEAVHKLSQKEAEFAGLKERGVLKEGYLGRRARVRSCGDGHDGDGVACGFSAGGSRLVCGNTGIDHVVVNGVLMYEFGDTPALSAGKVLRSGKDTQTVAIPRYASSTV